MADLYSHPSSEASSGFNQSGWTGGGEGKRAIRTKSVEAPKTGVYKIRLTLDDNAALFGQRRNIIDGEAPVGENEFLTCLTEYIPSMSNKTSRELRLFASACGGEIASIEAEETDARRIFIAGDSTVADQYSSSPYYPYDSYCGWGQALGAYLRRDAVCNMAHSGLTGRCFIEDGHFDIAKKYMRKGDLILIQFGHNDQKRRYLQADRRYTEYIGKIVRESEKLGAEAVLVSPISRVPSRDDAGVFDLLSEHAEALKALAQRLSLPFIDLHEYSFKLFASMGENCRALFKDMTHSNDPGALKIAGFVAGEMERLGLAKTVKPNGGFILSDTELNPLKIAPSPLPMPYVDIDDVEDKSVIYNGVQRGILDPCVLHMHPFEPMSRMEFFQRLLKVAGIQGRPTNGKRPYADIKPREFDSACAEACRELNIVEGEYIRPDDMIRKSEINELLDRMRISIDLGCQNEYPNRYELTRLLLKVFDERQGAPH